MLFQGSGISKKIWVGEKKGFIVHTLIDEEFIILDA